MKKGGIISLCICIMAFACKSKNTEPEKKFISVVSLIKEQVNHVDTSLYPILRLDLSDSTHTDTVFLPREQFANAAKDFLTIPDLGNPKVAKRYKEETIYNKSINRVTINYPPLHPQKEEVQQQELSIIPNPSGDKVKSVYITREISNRDSSLKKILLWQMDKNFQITTISQKPGKAEKTSIIKVTWNEQTY